jgi:hypothetical protein
VLGAVGGAQDNELRAAGDDAAAEGTGPGDYRRVAADPAGQLFPQQVAPTSARTAAMASCSASQRSPASNPASSSSNTHRIAGLSR